MTTTNENLSLDNPVFVIEPDHMCRKHGNIGRNYFEFVTDSGNANRKMTHHCGFCFREMLDANCEKAIPVPAPTEPYVGD